MEYLIEMHDHFLIYLELMLNNRKMKEKRLIKSRAIIEVGKKAVELSTSLLEEFVFEGELYIIPEYELKMVEEYLDQYIYSMTLFISENDAVDWIEEPEGELTLVVMPRLVTDILREKLFSSRIPIVFSSATLSVQENFSYLADGLGIQEFLSFSVESPFDYDEVMEVHAHDLAVNEKANKVTGTY